MRSVLELFNTLLKHYGPQHWWPCRSGAWWEIIAGAILTQNTAWTNVEKAIGNLLADNIMSPQKVLEIPDAELQELIRPAGFFKQKCAYLKAMAQFIIDYEEDFEKSDDVWLCGNSCLRSRALVGKRLTASCFMLSTSRFS